MSTKHLLLALAITLTFAIFSCKPDAPDASVVNFSWTFDGATYHTAVDTAINQSPGPYIITAVYGTSFISFTRKLDISPSSFAVGTYNFSMVGSNSFRYIDEFGNDLSGVSGTLNITGNSNNRLTGNFSGTLAVPAGGTKPITASFNNMILK